MHSTPGLSQTTLSLPLDLVQGIKLSISSSTSVDMPCSFITIYTNKAGKKTRYRRQPLRTLEGRSPQAPKLKRWNYSRVHQVIKRSCNMCPIYLKHTSGSSRPQSRETDKLKGMLLPVSLSSRHASNFTLLRSRSNNDWLYVDWGYTTHVSTIYWFICVSKVVIHCVGLMHTESYRNWNLRLLKYHWSNLYS